MNGRLWSAAEDAHIRERYAIDGRAACAAALGRTPHAARRRAHRLGLTESSRWQPADDARLTMMWGVHPMATIAQRLDRTVEAVYWRAGILELGRGCPQGHESIAAAARRTGYAEATILHILRWANVRIDRAWTRHQPKGKVRRSVHRVVETTDVDEAVARWCATEPIACIAQRLGVHEKLLRSLVEAASARQDPRIPTKPRGKRQHWRLTQSICEELIRERAERQAGTETLAEAAARVKRARTVLSKALKAAGVHVGPGVRLRPEDVDRVSNAMTTQRRRPSRGLRRRDARGPGVAKARPTQPTIATGEAA